jgi:hypothetical protein
MILLPVFSNVGRHLYTITLHFVGEALPFGGGEGRAQEMREELSQIVYMTLNTINDVSEIERLKK